MTLLHVILDSAGLSYSKLKYHEIQFNEHEKLVEEQE